MTRILPFEAVHNFRDFGGYPTEHGAHVRRGWLFRSGHLARAGEADCARVIDLGVGVVADLRRPKERHHEPSPLAQLGDIRVIDSDVGEDDANAPHTKAMKQGGELNSERVRGYMIQAYERIPFEERHVALYREVFSALVEGEGPLLIHCAAGKDRTGVLCALILDALGVDEATVMADYLLTNDAPSLPVIIESMRKRHEKKWGKPVTAEALRPLAGVERAYLETAYAHMRQRHGGVEGYRRDVLGVGADEVKALRETLLEPEPQPS